MKSSDNKLRLMFGNRARLKAGDPDSLRLVCVEEAGKTTRSVAPWAFMWLMVKEVSGTLVELSEKFGAIVSVLMLMIISICAILFMRGESNLARLFGELLRSSRAVYRSLPRRKGPVARTSMPDRETMGDE